MRPSAIILGLALFSGMPAAAGEAPAPPAATQPAALLSEAENASIDAVIGRAFAAGFPEVRTAVLILGKITISEPAPTDPSDGLDEMDMGFMEESSSSDGRRNRTLDGVHLRLPDGRWLAGMHRLIKPDATRTVTAQPDAVEVPSGQLPKLLAERGGTAQQVDESEETRFLDIFVPADRARVKAAMEASRNLRGLEWSTAPHLTIAILRRMQAIDTAPMAIGLAAADATPWMQMQQDQQDQALILDGGRWGENHPMANFNYETWLKEKVGTLNLPAPDRGLATAFSAWFQHLLLDPAALQVAGLTMRQAADAALAVLPPDLRQQRTPAIEGLIARQAIPAKAPDGADLATRIQSWEPTGNQGMFVSDGDIPTFTPEMLANIPAEHRARMQAMLDAQKAWRPSAADIAGLLVLLDDPRPSRWLDGRTPRTLGDNALRALHSVLRFDPRLLVGRSPSTAWTAAERSATAADLRGWWQRLDGKPLAQGLAAAIATLPPGAAASLLRATKADQRGPLLDRLAATWETAFPAGPATQIASIIGLSAGHAGLAAVVAKQPVQGGLRPLLACWHDRAGRPAELDRLLAEFSDHAPADEMESSRLAIALSQAARKPSPARLQRFMAMASGPLDDRRTWSVLAAISERSHGGDEAWVAVQALDGDEGRHVSSSDDEQPDPAQAIPLALAAICLADRRPLPEGLAKTDLQGQWGQIELPGLRCWLRFDEDGPPKAEPAAGKPARTPPTALRVRDIAACVLGEALWQLGLRELAQEQRQQRFDLWKPVDERDRAMQALIDAVLAQARPALSAAKLPDVLPADLAAPAAGDKALF